MSVKLHINASQGLLDIEGDVSFVERIYHDAKASGLFKVLEARHHAAQSSENIVTEDPPSTHADQKKKKRTAPKKNGPACTERIVELREAGFFDQMKKAGEVKDGLAKNGHSYAANQVGAALTALYKSGALRRSKIDSVWQYNRP